MQGLQLQELDEKLKQFSRPQMMESQRKMEERQKLQSKQGLKKQSRRSSILQLQSKFSKALHKNQTYPEQNARSKSRKYKVIPDRNNINKYLGEDSRHSSKQYELNSTQKLEMLNTLTKGYEIFKQINVAEQKKFIPKKLEPISKTVEYPIERSLQMTKEIKKNKLLPKDQLNKIKEQKYTNLKSVNGRLDKKFENQGKTMPLRLLLSNKVRAKIIRDLISQDEQKTKQNINRILSTNDNYEWIQQFKEIKKNIELEQINEKQKHHHQLLSRSNYQNAYYQYLALNRGEKSQYKKSYFSKHV